MTLTASLTVGNAASNLSIDKNLGIRLTGIDTWEDLRFPVNAVRKNAGTSKPDDVSHIGNTICLGFDNVASEGVTFSAQMSHTWLQGSSIRPHVHWSPTDDSDGSVRWQLEYSWANINGTFPTVATVGITDAAASQWAHQIAFLPTLDGTGKTYSSMLMLKLVRNVSHADDDYAADAGFLEFDFHYEVDSMGSEEPGAKTP
jgi:hypothetical protein